MPERKMKESKQTEKKQSMRKATVFCRLHSQVRRSALAI